MVCGRLDIQLRGELAHPAQFVGFRGFRLEVGISARASPTREAAYRVIQIAEQRRPKAFGIGKGQLMLRIQRQLESGVPGIFGAELLVVIVA